MSAGRQVVALLAHALVDTLAVAVALTGCQRGSGAEVSVNPRPQRQDLPSQPAFLLLTWALDEGPVVSGLAGAHAGVEGGRRAGGLAQRGGRGRDGGLEGPSIRALHALALAHVAGVGAPPAARLVQTLAAGSVAGAVLRCSTRGQGVKVNGAAESSSAKLAPVRLKSFASTLLSLLQTRQLKGAEHSGIFGKAVIRSLTFSCSLTRGCSPETPTQPLQTSPCISASSTIYSDF